MRRWTAIVLGAMTIVTGLAMVAPAHAEEVTLTPSWGVAGTKVTAELAGVCPGEYAIQGQTEVKTEESAESSARFEIPADWTLGPHPVKISCPAGKVGGQSYFTLVTAGADVAMAAPGSSITVSGAGFVCADRLAPQPEVTLVWGGRSFPAKVDSDGRLTRVLEVPEIPAGQYLIDVLAGCREPVSPAARIPLGVAAVDLPSTALAGSKIEVSGKGFSCGPRPGEHAGPLRVTLDGTPVPAESADADGRFSSGVAVPADSVFGRHDIVVACGDSSLPAAFEVVPREPRLVVRPERARPGGEVVVRGSRFDCGDQAGAGGDVLLTWESETRVRQTAGDGSFEERLGVPPDSAPRPWTFRARCVDDQRLSGQATLTIDPATSESPEPTRDPTPTPTPSDRVIMPTLRLHIGHGEHGQRVRVQGRGFACDRVEFGWAGRPGKKTDPVDGVFRGDLKVPADLSAGRHDVAARCLDNADLASDEQFDVLPKTDAKLRLYRSKGPPGTLVTAVGRDFPPGCATARLHFDKENRPLTAVPAVATGGEFTVPDREPGAYTAQLVCAGRATATATFTIPEGWFRTTFAEAVRAPDEVSWRLDHLVGSVILGVIIILMLGFPAEMFNKAYENSQGPGARSRTLRGIRTALGRVPVGFQFAVAVAAGAALLTFASPPDDREVRTAVAFAVALILTTLTFTVVNEVFTRWATEEKGSFRVLPGGLAVAAVCAVGSRWLDLNPGYVYGIITVFVYLPEGASAVVERGDDEDRARAVLVAAIATLTLSLVAWLAWIPSNDEALRASTDPLTLQFDAALAAVFVMGVQSVLFGLIPMPFLDGYKLTRWSWPLWGVVVGIALFAFVHIVYGKESEKAMELDWGAVREMLAAFAVFAVVSLAYWTFVRLRNGPAAPDPLPPQPSRGGRR
ncbi:FGLLP motif-containing membrane protein [Herbidospora mongoliensis]|uniref:FGLLP motif-containing membrane protein n=1 Tax=Herbidospora mongoliensis TaxID=688067 RepID=UPI00082C9313|nr:FGLLP motif-containing membrane protein [Herbidospora mongoliensis]